MDPRGPARRRHSFRTGRLSLVFFDIDGTLLLSGGAGLRAMTLTFEKVFGVPDAFAGITVAGHTDTFLVSQAFTRANVPDDAAAHAQFREAYIPILAAEIQHRGTGRRGLMPGVHALLTALQSDPGFQAALLTGNYEAAAQIKLTHFGVDHFFEWGAFGEEAADRTDLGEIAMRRAHQRSIPQAALDRAVIVGDTPHDIACARAIGARVLAVATGMYSVADLEEAGANVALPDLSDIGRVIELLR